MTIIVSETKKAYSLSMRLWRGGWNAGWEPDCFSDLEPNIPRDYPSDDDGNIIMPEENFFQACEWWENERVHANKDPEYNGDGLGGLSQKEIDNGDEWVFFCEEIDLI